MSPGLNDAPIGVFDSGMGGLTVMAALMKRLPAERFVYLGDTARLPYGTKSADTVRRYALQASHALTARGVKLVVIACNTASVALPQLRTALAPTPVIGVIEPGADAALAACPQGPIAVIATESTVKGGAYVRAIEARGHAPVVQQSCPLFVPLSEEGLTSGPIAEAIVHRSLDPLMATMPRPRCLLLGCTHYPALKDVIASRRGTRCDARRQRGDDGGRGRKAARRSRAGGQTRQDASRRNSWSPMRRTASRASARSFLAAPSTPAMSS